MQGTEDPDRDWRGLMIRHCPSMSRLSYELLVDGVSMKFSYVSGATKVTTILPIHCLNLREQLGDYGYFAYSEPEGFCCQGNLFADLESLSLKANITPRQPQISERGGRQRESGVVRAYYCYPYGFEDLYKPLGLSLPSDDDFKSLLASFSTRLTNRYLITGVIQCPPDPRESGSLPRHWYSVAKPFVWHRN